MRAKRGRGVDRKGRSKRGTRFTQVHEWLAESEAYRALKPGPRALLIELKLLYNGNNNGEIFFSVRDAARLLHVDKQTAAAWFWVLEYTGFIRARMRGTYSVKERHATVWILTEHDIGDSKPSKLFMKWRPGMSMTDRTPAKSWARMAKAAVARPSPSRSQIFASATRGDHVTQAVRLGHPDFNGWSLPAG
jgi:hypothetical protein